VKATEEGPKKFPFALQIILCFLALDSIERIWEAIQFLVSSDGDSWRVIVYGLWVATNVLLILLLTLKTFAGRLWTLVVFGIHIFYLGFHIVSQNKLLWLSLDEWSQGRILMTMLIDAWLMHLVSRQEVKELLTD
jgi:hypothetical protein